MYDMYPDWSSDTAARTAESSERPRRRVRREHRILPVVLDPVVQRPRISPGSDVPR